MATTAGEVLGFAVPATAAGLAGWALDSPRGLLLMALAGAGEGAVLGFAQSRVLRSAVPGLSGAAWTARTAAAAALAWAIGMTPSSLAGHWPPAVQIALLAPAAAVLLASIGTAQWTVLRHHVPGAAAWIAWTALGWLVGLGVFLGVATPLWQPGQSGILVAAIGVLAGGSMAVSMAAVTGAGLVRLLGPARRAAAPGVHDGAGTTTTPGRGPAGQ